MKTKALTEANVELLCSYIKKTYTEASDFIDDNNVKTNGTYSSKKIEDVNESIRTELKKYADDLVKGIITGITIEIASEEPTLDNTTPNKIYLYEIDNENHIYQQYLRTDTLLVNLCTTSINLSDYYTKDEIDNKGFLTEHQDISSKQDKLKAGNNITISDDNTISATDITVDKELNTESDRPIANSIVSSMFNSINNRKKYRYVKEINYGNKWDNWKRFGNIFVYQNGINIADRNCKVTADFETRDPASGKITSVDVNTWANGSIKNQSIIGMHSKVCSLTLDLGSLQVIDCIRIVNGHVESCATHNFDLLCSADGITWDTIHSYSVEGPTENSSYAGTVFAVPLSGNNSFLPVTLVGNAKNTEVDDFGRIQRAIDLASVSNGEVKLDAITYSISQTLQLDRNVVLRGSGINTTIIKLCNKSNCVMIKCKNKNTHFIGMDNLTIDGNGINQTTSNPAVKFNTWVSGFISNIYITNVFGEALVLGNGSMDLLISNVWALGCKVTSGKYQIDINSEYIDTDKKNGLITANSIYSEWPKIDWYKIDNHGNFINSNGDIVLYIQEDGTYKDKSDVVYTRTAQNKFTDSNSTEITAKSLGLVASDGMNNQADRGKAIRIACGASITIQKLHLEMSDTCIIQQNHIVTIDAMSTSHCGKDGDNNPILDIRRDNGVVKINSVANYNNSGTYFCKNLGDYANYMYPIKGNADLNGIVYGTNNNLGTKPIINNELIVETVGGEDTTGVVFNNKTSNMTWRNYIKDNMYRISKDWDDIFSINSNGSIILKNHSDGTALYESNSILLENNMLKIARTDGLKDIISTTRALSKKPEEDTIAYYVGQHVIFINNKSEIEDYVCTKITLETTTIVTDVNGEEVSNETSVSDQYAYKKYDNSTVTLENGDIQSTTYTYRYTWTKSIFTADTELNDTSENPVQNKVIKAKLDEVFQSVSNGKTLLETAITDKGSSVSKAGDVATFEELKTGIDNISTGVCELNIFTQTTEPTKKKGIWLNTDSTFNKIENYAEATYDSFAQTINELGYNNGLAFQYSKSCQVGKYCYIIGGNYHTKRNFRYNMETKETTTLAEIPMSFESGTVCTDGTYIYIMCAYSDHKTNYKYDIATNTYTTLPNGVKIDRPSSQYLNNKIYIFGNDDGSCYTYDLLTNTATRMANITYGSMINNRSIIIGNYIYIMFDYTKTGASYRYDTTTSTLTTLLNSPFKLEGTNIGLFEKNGYIYEFGYDNTGTSSSTVNVIYRYDIKNNNYKKLDKTTANNTVASSVHSYCFYNNTFTCFNDTYTSYSTFNLNENCLYLDKSEETNSALLVETPYDYLNKEEKFKNCFLTDDNSAIITCDSYIGNGTTWNKIN